MFLDGEKTDLVRDLRARMAAATAALRFEEAARLRDQLAAIERTLEPQERKGAKVRVLVPQRGWRLKLIDLARRNAEQGLRPRTAAQIEPPDVLQRVRERLGLRRIPRLMECFDVSHFHGGAIVAAQVAMTDGRPDKDRYRR